MKKEKYRVYAYAYEYGWEKFYCKKQEQIKIIIDELSPEEYGQYIVIKELPDRDEPFDYGFIAKPNKKKLKLDKKNRKK